MRILLILVLLLLAPPAAARSIVIQTADGTIEGELLEVVGDGYRVQTAEGEVVVPLDEALDVALQEVEPPAGPAPGLAVGQRVTLRTGDARVVGELLQTTSTGYRLHTIVGVVEVPYSEVQGIVVEPDRSPAPTAGIEWVRVRFGDGTELRGRLVERDAEGVTLSVAGEERRFTFADVVAIDFGAATTSPAPAAVPLPPAAAPRDPVVPPPPGWSSQDRELLRAYRQRRLQLTDRSGRWLGRVDAGYASGLLSSARGRYFVINPDVPRHRHSLADFYEITGSSVVADAVGVIDRTAARHDQVGLVVGLLGAGLTSTPAIVGLIDYAAAQGDPAFLPFTSQAPYVTVTPFLISAGVGALTASLLTHLRGARWRAAKQKRGRIDRYLDMEPALGVVEDYNAALREELGLPDDPTLDGPERR